MVKTYHFDRVKISELIDHIKFLPLVIHKITQPYENNPWYIYRRIFVNDKRARAGAIFWLHHKEALSRAQKEYGIPANIIVAIIGVESYYGTRQGKISVLNSLGTLAFYYPPRADFFRMELAQYLIMTKKLHTNPHYFKGSYAGAIGWPQFMPSSYLKYAVDFDHNTRIDLQGDVDDVIGSIANFFKQQGWKQGGKFHARAKAIGNNYKPLLNKINDTIYTVGELKKHGIYPTEKLPNNMHVNILRLKMAHHYKFLICFHDFYVLTKYNTSPEYVMAVLQLADKISSFSPQNLTTPSHIKTP
ncbi:MAG: lytic murein transglycosylase B [Gammaproteobacteria bacterium]|nr:lytic murein transglycosylase B [Gammaproteobacteria bacterium]